ncbi:MAG TPA: phage portal protein, partial [Gemmatimonadales bacterium]|nr:phage portal protein [Gemmatimonadales bacterium]
TSDSAESRFGQFEPAQMQNFVVAQDAIRADIARVSATPLHVLLMFGSVPSGEALEVLESPLMAKVTDRQDGFGPAWEDLARLTLIEEGTLNPGDRDTMLTARWKDTATKSSLDTARAVQVRRDLGISEKQGLRELGYEDAKIDEMQAEREAEAGDVADASVAAVNRGEDGGLLDSMRNLIP